MKKVIVDTSIWIDFFSGRLSLELSDKLKVLLDSELAVVTDIIKHELLIGAIHEREFRWLEVHLGALEEFRITADQLSEFNYFGFELRRKGLLGRYTDVTIAFLARAHHFLVFSHDQYFFRLSQRKIIEMLF